MGEEAAHDLLAGGPSDRAPIDPVEYVRGQLTALAYRSPVVAREVHILRLRKVFERARIVNQLRYALNILRLMREAQELPGGFWFPTPLRAVPIAECAILVGSIPTKELQRHFRGAERAGYARVSHRLESHDLPVQDLDSWIELDVADTVAWTAIQLATAQAAMGPTIVPTSIEYFTVRDVRSPFGTLVESLWVDDLRSAGTTPFGIVLCRQRMGRGSFRHFLGQIDRGRMIAEAPAPIESARMQFGLAALAGKRITVPIVAREEATVFHLSMGLPRAERQLVLALGVRDMPSRYKAYRIHGAALSSLVAAKLKNLGCEMR